MIRSLPINSSPETNVAPPRALVFCCLILVVLGSWWWNHDFAARVQIETLRTMNDVPSIWRGFNKTPNLWRDGLGWWHGPWIQEGISAYRPISSYLLWMETSVGFRFGFIWVARFGLVLLAINGALCCALAWVFTRAKLPTLTAALLAPAPLFWLMRGADSSWLAWYPVHHDLWMIGCLLAALLSWTLWLENGSPRALIATGAAFLVGVLSKEFLYIFPAMALWVALFYARRTVSLKVALWQVAALFVAVGALFLLRSVLLSGAYNPPPLKPNHFLRRPYLYWFPAFYKYVLTGEWFLPLLGLWCAVFPWLRRRLPLPQARWTPYFSVLSWLAGVLLISTFTVGITDGFWYLAELKYGATRLSDWVQLMATYVFLFLIFKHRRTQPTLAITSVFLLSYVPVWTYLGWHYTLAGWFVRAALWWPLFVHLLQIELAPSFKILEKTLQSARFKKHREWV